MVIRRRDSVGVVVVESGHEGAHHEIAPIEGLVDRWWHVDTPGNGFEIPDIERVGVVVTVPTHYVEGVVRIEEWKDGIAFLDAYLKVAAVVEGFQRFRAFDVAFAKRGMFEHLTKLVAVPFRREYRPVRFDEKQAVFRRFKLQFVHRATRYH